MTDSQLTDEQLGMIIKGIDEVLEHSYDPIQCASVTDAQEVQRYLASKGVKASRTAIKQATKDMAGVSTLNAGSDFERVFGRPGNFYITRG